MFPKQCRTRNRIVEVSFFGVFGPPTIIFFDKNGLQRTGYEVVGYMKAPKFIEWVELALENESTITALTVGE